MEIKYSEFVISSPTVSTCPKDTKNEYAFIGRSNVGKSSLINMLCRRKNLAKTSATPGYGFAKRSKTVQKKLEQMISGYLLQREQLMCTFVLIDVRHDPQLIDREFIDWMGESGLPFAIVFTKADKLGELKARKAAKEWMEKMRDRWEELPPYFVTSSEKALGRDELLGYIESINKQLAEETVG